MLRGLMILLLGYVLNIIREIIPLYIGIERGLFSSLDLSPYSFLTILLQVDILQFAGLALIFLGVLAALKINRWVYLPLALGFSLANPHLWNVQTGNTMIDYLLDPLWGVDDYIYFPFFTWIFYPLIGVVVGNLLIRAKDKNIFYRVMFTIGLCLLILGSIIGLTNLDFHLGDYYRHAIGSHLWMTGFVLVWWSLLYFGIQRFTLPESIHNRIVFWSKNVTALYFIHWVIIGWGVLLLGYESAALPVVILLMAVFTILSDRLTYLWARRKVKTKQILVAE
jgi:hypothetical protein